MIELYDPLTYDNLMAGTILEFERRPLLRLADDISVRGPGIYCLVYTGPFDVYGEKSWWDTVHPGRGWADNLRSVKTLEEAIERVQTFFASEQS